jgi:HTH-type transcriptional repressor of puuD
MSNTAQQERGRRVREHRLRAGLGIRALARQVDVAPSTIYRVESGTLNPVPALRLRIATALRVDLFELWPLDEIELDSDEAEAVA